MQKIITLFLATFLVAVSSARADFELIGSGWSVTGLHDTAVGNESYWSLNGAAIIFAALSPDFTDLADGESRYSFKSKPDEALVFSTDFTVKKLDNPLTATALIAFSLWTSKDVTSILVNDKAVVFSEKEGQSGWYDLLLFSELFTADESETFTLKFVYNTDDWGQVTVLDFGVKFYDKFSSINPTTPEPAT
ncbi:MAG: hypothetical protein LBT89_03595, partial [Planctomycetaceae bacterium]|nr:hypothetical protein [Planctomycetaceae bacterium]